MSLADIGLLHGAVLLLFTLGWIPVFVLRSERFHERRAAASPDERRAMWNAAAAVTAHVTLAEIALTFPDVAPPPLRVLIGAAIFAVGLAFWALARHSLVAYGRVLDPTTAPAALVTTGPFAVVRHPLSLGMVILALGPAVAAASGLVWTSFLTAVVALGRRCHQDEVELNAAFGDDYARYAATTPARLIPFLW